MAVRAQPQIVIARIAQGGLPEPDEIVGAGDLRPVRFELGEWQVEHGHGVRDSVRSGGFPTLDPSWPPSTIRA
jgi:hypothetical protein